MGIVARRHGWKLDGAKARVEKHMVVEPVRRIGRLVVEFDMPAVPESARRARARRAHLPGPPEPPPGRRARHPLPLGVAGRAKEPHARRHGRHLPGAGRGAHRSQRLPERAPPRRSRRAARLRVALGRRAPLHRLHDVPRRAAVPDLLRRAHASGSSSARWWSCCRGTTRCASPSRWSCSTTCRTGASILGIGRGLGRVEFEGFGVEQEDSRAIFVESAQMLLEGLERGFCEYDGKFVKQARRELRPRPFKSFRGRTYAAAVSPESSEIMARLGIGILIIPQKPWELVVKELNDYRAVFREVNGVDAPPPIVGGWTLLRRERRPRRGARAPVHRRVLALGGPPLRADRRPPRPRCAATSRTSRCRR